jgi:hypothetical protein
MGILDSSPAVRKLGAVWCYLLRLSFFPLGMNTEFRVFALSTVSCLLLGLPISIARAQSAQTGGASIGYENEQTAPGATRLHRSATFGMEWLVP